MIRGIWISYGYHKYSYINNFLSIKKAQFKEENYILIEKLMGNKDMIFINSLINHYIIIKFPRMYIYI